MRANHVSANHLLGLRWFVLAFLLVVALGDAFAAGKVRVTPQSNQWHRQGQNADGSTRWAQKAEFNAFWEKNLADAGVGGGVAAASEFFTSTGPISSSTLGSMGRKAIRGGVYGTAVALAVEGIIDGAGWAIGELKDQVIDPGTKEQLQGHGWCKGTVCAPTIDGLVPFLQKNNPPYDPSVVTRWIAIEDSPTAGRVCALVKPELGGGCAVSISVGLVTRPTLGWDGFTNVSPGTDSGPVSDEQLGDAIRPHPDVVNSLLTDPRTGRPVMTPELQQMMDDIKQQIEQREGMPGSDPSPAPDMEDDTAKDDGSPWPSFCGWATVVCEFIDWFKDDNSEDVALPEEELEIQPSQWSSGIGGGSCPVAESVTVSVLGTSGDVSFDWQPLCRMASELRPFLIAISTMVAALIIAGVRRSAA